MSLNETTTYTDDQLDALLGAFALHAIDEVNERTAVEDYLLRSPRAASEVRDHTQVAAALGGSARGSTPPEWSRIEAALGEQRRSVAPPFASSPTSSSSPTASSSTGGSSSANVAVANVVPFRRRSIVATVAPWLATAAAVAAVAFLGVQNRSQINQLDDAKIQLAAEQVEVDRLKSIDTLTVDRLMASPGTKVASLTDDAVAVAKVVVAADGRGFLVMSDNATLPEGEVYQLWGVQGESVISLGVMSPGVSAMPLSASGDWSKFVLTAEVPGGVVVSDGPALAAGVYNA
jgi:Anti-sigma-K factor rskA